MRVAEWRILKLGREDRDRCAVLRALKILGRKWVPWILCELVVAEELYFSDLLRRVVDVTGEQISARVLSESLSLLEREGVVARVVEPDTMPIRVRYSLTEKGRDLKVILGVLKGWGIKWGDIDQKLCKSFTCVHNGIGMIDIDKLESMLEYGPSGQNGSATGRDVEA